MMKLRRSTPRWMNRMAAACLRAWSGLKPLLQGSAAVRAAGLAVLSGPGARSL